MFKQNGGLLQSLVVRWQAPPLEHQNGKITGYKIRYKKKNAKQGSTVTTAGNILIYNAAKILRTEFLFT